MGRKTNSVSLRLKKTNRDFNDCWYGDILYNENLSKSLKIKALLLQTLKSATVPCAHLSLIGAFKKSNIFVGYLDPEPTRKHRSESFYLKMYPRLPHNTRPAEGPVLAVHSKHSKILQSTSKPHTLLYLPDKVKPTISDKPLQKLCCLRTAKGSENVNCKDRLLHTNLPNICTDSSIPRKSQDSTFAKSIANNTSLGLVLHRQFGLQDKKPSFKGKGFIVTKHYKCFTMFPRSSLQRSVPEKLISVFSTLQSKAKPVSGKLRVPIHDIFRVIGFLYTVKTAFREIECKVLDNKTLYWFSQRKTFFCATELQSKCSHVNLAYTKRQLVKEKKERVAQQRPLCLQSTASIAFAAYVQQRHQHKQAPASVAPCAVALLRKQSKDSKQRHQEAEVGTGFTYSRRLFSPSNHTYSSPQSVSVESISPYLKRLQNIYSSFWGNFLCISLYKSINEKSSALFLANSIAYYLERRVLFRQLKRQLLLELPTLAFALRSKAKATKQSPISDTYRNTSRPMFEENTSKIIGIRVSCSGRVGGRSKKAQRSRKETFMWGETGLHVFSSKLDFARTHAETGFGLVGIQVWVCYK